MCTNGALSAILFQPITARLFPIAVHFSALSILTILRDKQLMKSFENINILIKVKLFCWKKFFFQKSFYLKKDCHLKEKNFIWVEERFFVEKKKFFEKFFEKKLLYTNDALSAIFFQPITARLFLIAVHFSALSILTILRDKQLMKSFENINILIKVKLFCWKKFFFQKSFYLKKDCHLKEKKFYLGRRTFLKSFLKKKTFFWKKTCFCEKNFFLKKFLKIFMKKMFLPLVPKSLGA